MDTHRSLEMFQAATMAKYLLESFIENHKETVIHENIAPTMERFKNAIAVLRLELNEHFTQEKNRVIYEPADFQLLANRFVQMWGYDVKPTDRTLCGYCGIDKPAAAMIPGRNIYSTIGCCEMPLRAHDPLEYKPRCRGCEEKRKQSEPE